MNNTDSDLTSRISIVSDEISDDFSEAASFANTLSLRNFELRKFTEGRIPDIEATTLRKLLDGKEHFNFTLISPGYFKHFVSDRKKTNHQTNRIQLCIDLAKRLEAKFISVFTFKRNSRDSKIPEDIYEPLLRLKDLCENNSLILLLENSPNCWADTVENLLSVAYKTGIDVNWDPGNSLASGHQNHQLYLGPLLQITKNIHLKNWGPDIGYCSILSGAYDLASEINYFLYNKYPGYFCIEHHQWNNRKESTLENLNELKSIICKFRNQAWTK
ncbi:MAG: TIM barrel protein [SAR324 cluster bacterium]|jgi:sugar phosphate isomerase/epimerase|nr:TIM barrel protein [SAR324 cluster bacterium]